MHQHGQAPMECRRTRRWPGLGGGRYAGQDIPAWGDDRGRSRILAGRARLPWRAGLAGSAGWWAGPGSTGPGGEVGENKVDGDASCQLR